MPPAILEMDKLGVRAIQSHGEKAAAYMADGYARITNRVGVCLAHPAASAHAPTRQKDAAGNSDELSGESLIK